MSTRGRTGGTAGRAVGRPGVGVATALVMGGCALLPPGSAAAPTVRPDELASAAGRPCPEDLPLGEDPSVHGFGVERPAEQLPSLLEPQEAWLCQYAPVDTDQTSASGGSVLAWRLEGRAAPLEPERLPALTEALDALSVFGREQACTADLGPRWMTVYSQDGDLTGVVVDGYGCRSVRLTDDPHTTPPGQDGTVGGVLDGGPAILDAVGRGG